MNKIIWLCPILMLALSSWVFTLFGFSIWAAVFISLLLVCPAIIIYGIITIVLHPRGFSTETLHTRGMPLDILAPIYDWYCPKIGLGIAFRQETLRHADLKAGEYVLDVGCGTGALTRLAAKAVGQEGKAIGIDPSAKMIAIALRNANAEGSSPEFKLAVIEEIPFEANTFDCVLSSLMLHHLPPDLKIKGLSEAYRVLKPGGRFILIDIDRPSNPIWWAIFWPMLLWSFTKEQLKGRLGEIILSGGFSKVEKVGVWGGFLGFWKAIKSKM